ncbi:uncharacterized protein LOC122307014 [Carya illinoinensis]|uniref:uncharacterized protein LOC122307014 n=1 Tax=Carya illinoinensis TaxID=32201 RepID=UPI001C724A3F|nr:uncharacterized protein LOC122307014 [Carya illinoinensis]
MDNLLDEDPFFTTLLQSGGEGPITTPTFSQHSNVVVASTPLTVKRGLQQKKFKEELLSLLRRIMYLSLKCTNKFCAYLAQVESLHLSGATEQDMIEKTKILYKEMERGNFTMDHSWNLLRHQPKWHQHMNTLNTRRKPHDKRPSNEQSSEILDDVVEEHVERSAGKKAEKEDLRKRKAQESSDAEFNMALGAMTEDRQLFMAERREWQTKADRDRGTQLELDKRKFDAEMMSKDLSGMNAM